MLVSGLLVRARRGDLSALEKLAIHASSTRDRLLWQEVVDVTNKWASETGVQDYDALLGRIMSRYRIDDVKRNSSGDERLRELRRSVASGDRIARLALEREKRRRGLPSLAGAKRLERVARDVVERHEPIFCACDQRLSVAWDSPSEFQVARGIELKWKDSKGWLVPVIECGGRDLGSCCIALGDDIECELALEHHPHSPAEKAKAERAYELAWKRAMKFGPSYTLPGDVYGDTRDI